uniref:(northern house mosquito) hypothetical protein n=1 Tax=Culex pipiens TaxID=7175 RepID=A0A8D8I3G6_CULPI
MLKHNVIVPTIPVTNDRVRFRTRALRQLPDVVQKVNLQRFPRLLVHLRLRLLVQRLERPRDQRLEPLLHRGVIIPRRKQLHHRPERLEPLRLLVPQRKRQGVQLPQGLHHQPEVLQPLLLVPIEHLEALLLQVRHKDGLLVLPDARLQAPRNLVEPIAVLQRDTLLPLELLQHRVDRVVKVNLPLEGRMGEELVPAGFVLGRKLHDNVEGAT